MTHESMPLVVDLDGTLTPTDTLFEAALCLLRKAPWMLLLLPLWLLRGRASLKQELASRVSLDVRRLPYRHELLDYLREQRALGRKIVLATAAHESIANDVAHQLGLFDQFLIGRRHAWHCRLTSSGRQRMSACGRVNCGGRLLLSPPATGRPLE